jgi:serine/threonine protein phosphatase PrpC
VQLQPLAPPPLPPSPKRAVLGAGRGPTGGGAADAAALDAAPAAYLAVFDGHNGAAVAHSASTGLHLYLKRRLLANSRAHFAAAEASRRGLDSDGESPALPLSASGLSEALAGAFCDFDRWLHANARPSSGRHPPPGGAETALGGAAEGAVLSAGHESAGVGAADGFEPGVHADVEGEHADVEPLERLERLESWSRSRRGAHDDASAHDDAEGAASPTTARAREAALHALQMQEHLAAEEAATVATHASHPGASHPAHGGGTTALVCVTCQGRLHLASVGDSRAVLAFRNAFRNGGGALGTARRLTTDHTPALPSELDRIVGAGGFVSRGRVAGILAVSRALGDLELQPYVSPVPEVSVVDLRDEASAVAADWGSAAADEPPPAPVLVLATDGVWGCLTDDEAAAIATAHEDPQAAAEELLEEVSRRGGRDNSSVIVAAWPADWSTMRHDGQF